MTPYIIWPLASKYQVCVYPRFDFVSQNEQRDQHYCLLLYMMVFVTILTHQTIHYIRGSPSRQPMNHTNATHSYGTA